MSKYLVVDGYALCYRAWHGYAALTNNEGKDTKVTVGFFKMLLSRVPDLDDRRIVFCFDSVGPTFRHKLDENYKGNRSKTDADFYRQVEEVVHLCKMIAPVLRADSYEADDLAGSFVKQYVTEEDDCLLLTVDGDWLQLLRPGVTMLQLKTQGGPVLWDRHLFFEKHTGLVPPQLVDMKALMGDGSDNIPGIKGVGWSATLKLLTAYGSVEGVYNNIMKITNKGQLQAKLIDNKDRVMLNKELATIKCDIDISVDHNPETGWDNDAFLDYLVDKLQAVSLTNLMGVYLQKRV